MPSGSPLELAGPPPDSGGRRRLNGARQEELLDQVQEIILAEGFASLTVDELAARLLCSKSTLYTVSSSKEHLVATAIRRFLEEVAQASEERIAGIDDPAARVATFLNALGDGMQRMSRSCFEDVGANDSTREVYLRHSAAVRERIGRFIADGIKVGQFRPVPTAFVTEAISLLIDGIQWGRLPAGPHALATAQGGMSLSEAYETLSDLVLAALTDHGSSRLVTPR